MGGVAKAIIKPIAKLVMPSAPAMPAIPEPQPLPEAPKYDDTAREEDVAEKRAAIRRNRKGRSSTILTTASGLAMTKLLLKKQC